MQRKLDLSVGQRLTLGFGTTLLLLLLLVGFTTFEQFRVDVLEQRITKLIGPRADAAHQVQRALLAQSLAARNFALLRTPAAWEMYEKTAAETRMALHQLEALPKTPDGQVLYERVLPLSETYQSALARFVNLARENKARDVVRAEEAEMTRVREALLQRSEEFAALQFRKRQAAREEILAVRAVSSHAFLLLSFLMMGVGVATAVSTTQAVRGPTLRLVKVMRAMEAGDFRLALALRPPGAAGGASRPRDELRELGLSVGKMAAVLQTREERLAADARVSAALSSSIEVEELTRHALSEMAEFAGCEFGAVYLRAPGEESLRRRAAYALDGAAPSVRLGEGIPGQAALEQKTLVVRDIPASAPFQLRFGFDNVPPRTVVAIPLLFQKTSIGVMLLGSIRDLDTEEVEFLEQGARSLCISLQNALAHEELGRLAVELQRRAEILQTQNEKLEAQREEIHAQNEELQAQTEEIQAQNEEIQAQNEELRLHTEELAEVDRQKDNFLAMLGHELRNPLAAVRNAAAVLRGGEPNGPAWQRALAVVERQLRHQSRIVDELLDISRINRGKIELQCEAVDLRRLAMETVEDFRRTLPETGQRVELALPPEPVVVHGDMTRLSQCLVNLLNNAVKYSDQGSPISVSLSLDEEAARAAISVKDRGIGISPNVLPRVWDAFMQEDRSLDRSRGGLGLGLSLVKALIELHGGEVGAYSNGLGQGAEFRLELPLLTGGQPPALADASTAAQGRRLSILVIEDNMDAAETIRDLLELDGHRVEVAFSGSTGLEAARRLLPDVVLCDIGLPGLDGYEVARGLRAEPETASLHLIALSGYGESSALRRSTEAGFDLHLVKPVDPERLQKLLNKLPPRGLEREQC